MFNSYRTFTACQLIADGIGCTAERLGADSVTTRIRRRATTLSQLRALPPPLRLRLIGLFASGGLDPPSWMGRLPRNVPLRRGPGSRLAVSRPLGLHHPLVHSAWRVSPTLWRVLLMTRTSPRPNVGTVGINPGCARRRHRRRPTNPRRPSRSAKRALTPSRRREEHGRHPRQGRGHKGASSGLGEATARHLAARGAKVFLGARRRDRLRSIVADIERAGGLAAAVTVDVTSRTEVEAFVKAAIEKFGRMEDHSGSALPPARLTLVLLGTRGLLKDQHRPRHDHGPGHESAEIDPARDARRVPFHLVHSGVLLPPSQCRHAPPCDIKYSD